MSGKFVKIVMVVKREYIVIILKYAFHRGEGGGCSGFELVPLLVVYNLIAASQPCQEAACFNSQGRSCCSH